MRSTPLHSDLDHIVGHDVNHGAEVVVVEDDGVVIATGVLLAAGGRTGQIVGMAVAREHRRRASWSMSSFGERELGR